MKRYRGYRTAGDGVVVEWTDDEHQGDWVPLQHYRQHSPAGFEWGYYGSGPADLARSLIIDHLGPAASCPTCDGTGILVVPDVGRPEDAELGDQGQAYVDCFDCHGDRTSFSPGLYQRLKFEVVSTWGDAWEISAGDLDAFLSGIEESFRPRYRDTATSEGGGPR